MFGSFMLVYWWRFFASTTGVLTAQNPDVIVGSLPATNAYGTNAGTNIYAYSVATTSCNIRMPTLTGSPTTTDIRLLRRICSACTTGDSPRSVLLAQARILCTADFRPLHRLRWRRWLLDN